MDSSKDLPSPALASLLCSPLSPFATTARNLRIAAPSSISVLLCGETGTGKEVVARALHTLSERRAKPFVAVNCGALPESLLESQLFGHRRGSFTGADQDQPGLVQSAHNSTLFLDEVGELPLSAQSRLLRVLQERRVRPVGSSEEIPVDFRLVCATHRDLESRVAQGVFREDLFYRIAVFPIALPALRERQVDLPQLARQIWSELGRQTRPLLPEEITLLCQHSWPGNIRELRNVLERHHLLYCHGIPLEEHLQPQSSKNQPQIRCLADSGIRRRVYDPQIIARTLQDKQHNRTQAALALGMSRGSLQYQIRKMGL